MVGAYRGIRSPGLEIQGAGNLKPPVAAGLLGRGDYTLRLCLHFWVLIFFFNLFIFDCVGSSLLRAGFL